MNATADVAKRVTEIMCRPSSSLKTSIAGMGGTRSRATSHGVKRSAIKSLHNGSRWMENSLFSTWVVVSSAETHLHCATTRVRRADVSRSRTSGDRALDLGWLALEHYAELRTHA